MGLFGGDEKKKKAQRGRGDDEARSSTTKRKSRRIVTPGQKGGSDSARVERRTRSSAVRPAAEASRPPPAQPKAPPPAQPKAPPPQAKQKPVAKPPPPPPPPPKPAAPPAGAPDLFADDEPQVVAPAVKRDAGKQPISLDESGDLEFGGDLSAAKGSGQRGQVSHSGDQPLIEFLVDKAKLIDAEQAQAMLSEAGSKDIPVDQACIQAKLLSEDQLVNALTQECWVPHLKVDKYEIRKKALDTISEVDARYFSVLPVDKLGSILNLAMVNPLDVDAIDELQGKTGLDIKKVVATRSEIEQGIARYYGGGAEAKEGSLEIAQDKDSQRVTTMLSRKPAEEAPVASPEPVAATPQQEIVDDDQIADIDDLLGGNEEVAPAIIEPITLDASEFEEEPFEDDDEELFEPELVEEPEVIEEIEVADEAPALQRQAPEDSAEDLEPAILPGTARHVAPPAPPAPVVAEKAAAETPEEPSLELPSIEEAAAREPVAEPAPVAKAPSPPPAPAKAEPVEAEPAVASTPAPAAPRPSTARKPAPPRKRSRDLVDLVPVMEEDFQHAISHGKARIFEKWVSLQTRNRILNAVGVEQELDGVLIGLYEQGERISA